MTLNPRQSALVELVRTQGSATIEALARHFDVTLQTVRRDVNLLSEAGMLSRFHGGVRIESSTIENIAYRKRQGLHAEGKRRIAEAVARAVPDGCSLLINIGTTTEAIARACCAIAACASSPTTCTWPTSCPTTRIAKSS